MILVLMAVVCELCAEREAEKITEGGLHLCLKCYKRHGLKGQHLRYSCWRPTTRI